MHASEFFIYLFTNRVAGLQASLSPGASHTEFMAQLSNSPPPPSLARLYERVITIGHKTGAHLYFLFFIFLDFGRWEREGGRVWRAVVVDTDTWHTH